MKTIIIIDPPKRKKLYLMRATRKVVRWIMEDYDVEIVEVGVHK